MKVLPTGHLNNLGTGTQWTLDHIATLLVSISKEVPVHLATMHEQHSEPCQHGINRVLHVAGFYQKYLCDCGSKPYRIAWFERKSVHAFRTFYGAGLEIQT
jgi:hypothetical protein